jgi:uncharacterized protein (TIGR02246 family)
MDITTRGLAAMPRLRSIMAGALVALGACTQATKTADPAKVISAIQKVEEEQNAALAQNDLDRAVTIFTEDSTVYFTGQPPMHGRAAIKAFNARALKDPALKVVIDEANRKTWVAASGELATTAYRYAWTHTDAATGRPVTEQVASQTTWEKQADGTWKNVMDINVVYAEPVTQ